MEKANKTYKIKQKKVFLQGQKLLKLLCIALTLYLLIAVLHGLLPGIWEKSFGGKEGKGPFRILMFTPLLVLLFFFLCIKYTFEKNFFLKPKVSHIKNILKPNSHRGPPSFQ